MSDEILNIISLERRHDRRESLIPHLDHMGVKRIFWPGIEGEHFYPFVNIMRAHKRIVQMAQFKGMPRITIGEDDIRFSKKGAWEYYLSQIPDDYDMFFGMVYCGHIPDNRIQTGFAGMQLYTIHEKHYDFFLNASEEMHIDMYLGEWAYKHGYFVCNPFVCYGVAGFSDNQKRHWEHTLDRLPNKLYGMEDN